MIKDVVFAEHYEKMVRAYVESAHAAGQNDGIRLTLMVIDNMIEAKRELTIKNIIEEINKYMFSRMASSSGAFPEPTPDDDPPAPSPSKKPSLKLVK